MGAWGKCSLPWSLRFATDSLVGKEKKQGKISRVLMVEMVVFHGFHGFNVGCCLVEMVVVYGSPLKNCNCWYLC